MIYQVALDPKLQVRPDDFSRGWNENSACRQVAQAQVQPNSGAAYDLSLNDIILLVILPIAGNIAASGIYDLIKDVLLKKGIRKKFTFFHQKQADETELLVVTMETMDDEP